MNRTATLIVVVIVIVALVGFWYVSALPASPASPYAPAASSSSTASATSAADTAEEAAVRTVVMSFGSVLQQVSLLDTSAAAAQMEEFYGPYVAPDLLRSWEAAPTTAPGRLVSSPWPDRIEVSSVTPQSDGSYAVSGNVIEKTSTDDAGSYPVKLTLVATNGSWLITEWSGYPPPTAAPTSGT